MRQVKQDLSFVGLGQIGQQLALHLLKAAGTETEIRLFDMHEERVSPLVALGASQAFRLADVARPGSIAFTMVPDDQALLQVVVGEGGLLSQLGSGGVHISLSIISPQVATQLTKLYARQGSAFLAAPVLGCPDMAQRGNLTLFLSGDRAAKKRAHPFLAALTRQIHDLGERVEDASLVAIAAQFLIAASIEAMGEAAALVEAHGLNRSQFLRMLIDSLLVGGDVFERYGQMIGTRDFSETLLPVSSGLKTVEMADEVSEQVGIELPYTEALLEHLLDAQKAGRGTQDWSVLTEYARVQPDRLGRRNR